MKHKYYGYIFFGFDDPVMFTKVTSENKDIVVSYGQYVSVDNLPPQKGVSALGQALTASIMALERDKKL